MNTIANDNICWHRAAPKPVALLIRPWADGGATILHRDASGNLYGCRDVSNKLPSDFAICLAAWIKDAKDKGLPVEDTAGAFAAIQKLARQLNAVACQ